MKTIYLRNDDETKEIKFFEIEDKTEILNQLFQKYQSISGNLKFDEVIDEDGDVLYESGCRYY